MFSPGISCLDESSFPRKLGHVHGEYNLLKKEGESMKSKRYSEEQIIRILKEKEAVTPGKELCRRYGMSESTLYKWLKKYGGMEVNDAMRLKTLEKENTQQKKLVAPFCFPPKSSERITVTTASRQPPLADQIGASSLSSMPC